MRTSWVFGLALAAVSALSGCDQLKGGGGGVVVVDLDGVAKAVGSDKAIETKLTAHNQELAQQLEKVRDDLRKSLAAEQAKLGPNPSPELKQAFQQKFQAAQQAFNERNQQAQQDSNKFRLAQAQEFRDKVKPVAEEIAKKKGATIVTTPVTLLWTDPNSDITADVIKQMSTGKAPEKPATGG